jgi:hypothetical protein
MTPVRRLGLHQRPRTDIDARGLGRDVVTRVAPSPAASDLADRDAFGVGAGDRPGPLQLGHLPSPRGALDAGQQPRLASPCPMPFLAADARHNVRIAASADGLFAKLNAVAVILAPLLPEPHSRSPARRRAPCRACAEPGTTVLAIGAEHTGSNRPRGSTTPSFGFDRGRCEVRTRPPNLLRSDGQSTCEPDRRPPCGSRSVGHGARCRPRRVTPSAESRDLRIGRDGAIAMVPVAADPRIA